ncbi:MAG: hypothetical protein ABSA63_05120 [Thermoplasmata archaeon]|jgi:hypothetical protein
MTEARSETWGARTTAERNGPNRPMTLKREGWLRWTPVRAPEEG